MSECFLLSFNPFWDLSQNPRKWISRNRNSFNPFWDLSHQPNYGIFVKPNDFQSLLGFIVPRIRNATCGFLLLSIPFGIYQCKKEVVVDGLFIFQSLLGFIEYYLLRTVHGWKQISFQSLLGFIMPKLMTNVFGLYDTFNPFWDLSHYHKTQTAMKICYAFNPFWDLSFFHGERKMEKIDFFQSLLGFILGVDVWSFSAL